MRKDAPNIRREPLRELPVEDFELPNGTFWKCGGCGRDNFGKFIDGTLEIKYKERVLTVDGIVTVTCRSCGVKNQIDLRNYPYNVKIHFNAEPFPVEITESALQLAQEHKIDIQKITGSGKDGKIVASDIKKLIT